MDNNLNTNTFSQQILFDKYKINYQIGKGSFGTVFSGTNILTKEKVAIKTETKTKNTQNYLLEEETRKLDLLKGFKGIPTIYHFVKTKENNYLIMELLGKTLKNLFILNNNKFSLQTVCFLGYEMIRLINYIHTKQILHRDIKPENFVMGRDDKKDILYIIDFGLAKRYINNNNEHIPFKTGKNIIGTARYCSIYTHKGYEQSRRDDLESIGYLLIYFLRGNLPWQGTRRKKEEKLYEQIGIIKMNTSVNDLCNGFPNEIKYYFDYVKQLQFEEEPNYDYLSEIFEWIIKKYNDIEHYRKFNRKDQNKLLDLKSVNSLKNSTGSYVVSKKKLKNKKHSKKNSTKHTGKHSVSSSFAFRNTLNSNVIKRKTEKSSNNISYVCNKKQMQNKKMGTNFTKDTNDDTKNVSDCYKERELKNNSNKINEGKDDDRKKKNEIKKKSVRSKSKENYCKCIIF